MPSDPPARPPLILASGSPYRRKMLQAAGLAFQVVPAGVDEAALKRDLAGASARPAPAVVATALARAKAEAADPPATVGPNQPHAPSPITLHASPSSTHQSPITDHPFAPWRSTSSPPSVPPVPSLCTPCTESASSSSRHFPLADQPLLPLPELFKRAVRKLHTLPPPTTRAQQRELAHATKIHNRMFPDEPLPIPPATPPPPPTGPPRAA